MATVPVSNPNRLCNACPYTPRAPPALEIGLLGGTTAIPDEFFSGSISQSTGKHRGKRFFYKDRICSMILPRVVFTARDLVKKTTPLMIMCQKQFEFIKSILSVICDFSYLLDPYFEFLIALFHGICNSQEGLDALEFASQLNHFFLALSHMLELILKKAGKLAEQIDH